MQALTPAHKNSDLAADMRRQLAVQLSTRANSLRRSSEQCVAPRNMLERLSLSMKRFFSSPWTSSPCPPGGVCVCV